MHSSKRFVVGLVALALAAAGPVLAQPAASEASGKVVDQDGNPVAGAKIIFSPKGHDTTFSETTNKKGRYFLPGLFHPGPDDEWSMTIEAEGLAPVEVTIESRNASRVLVGDIFTKAIQPGAGLPPLRIRPLGVAKIDFKMAPADLVEEQARTAAEAAAAAAAAAAGEPVQPKADPWDEGLRLAGDGDLAGAIPLLTEAVEEEPEDAERRETLAKILYQEGRYPEAAAAATRAIELAPDGVEARMVLYSVHVAQGDFDEAQTTLEAAQAIAPGDIQILQQLAYLAGETGDQAEAITVHEQITQVDPDNTEAWMALGDLYAATGDTGKSEQAYQQVVALDPSNAHQIFFNLGALTMNKPNRSESETQQAISAFRKAVEIKPDYAQAYKQLAFALLGVGDRQGAGESLAQYVKLAPDAADAAQMQKLVETLQN
jgi:Flp pilus assembly protein TadD